MDNGEFIFGGYRFDLNSGKASFNYRIAGGENFEFTEKIEFSATNSSIPPQLLASLFQNISLILGISYWKIYAPKKIEVEGFSLTKDQADFWNKVFTKGLGEFFYKNRIDFRGLINFPYNQNTKLGPTVFPRRDRILLPIGGGKDSIVTAEILKKDKKPFDVLVIGDFEIPLKVAETMEKRPIVIKRELDPKLFDLNKRENVYNGHIPVSVIYAFLGVLAAILYDYSEIVVSNEKSANYGNVTYLGEEINHQWSKSEEFEDMFGKYLAENITTDIKYYSFLRDYTELEITEIFSKHPKYFRDFSSCNTNFRISDSRPNQKWCGKCPKCLFVFTMLSAYITKQELVNIFGKNLFEDKNLLPYFKELLGWGEIKPFECVGTPQEMETALNLASRRGDLKGNFLMAFYENNK